jgi:integrase/recombinase XerD
VNQQLRCLRKRSPGGRFTPAERVPPVGKRRGCNRERGDRREAEIGEDRKGPLLRTAWGRKRQLTGNRLHRTEALAMIKRRAKEAGLPPSICCHTFRATGITVYLENGGTLEKAQQIACHESARTTKLYDRTQDQISLDEVERIVI